MNVLTKFLLAASAAATILAMPATVSLAQDANKKAFDERIKFMKELGGALGAILKVVKGEAAFGPNTVEAAEAVAFLSPHIAKMFPPGSDVGESRAKPEIWANMDDFKKKAAAVAPEARKLVPAVKTGDKAQIGSALGEVGKTCAACHDQYQKPQT